MDLKHDLELRCTQEKLRALEECLEASQQEPCSNPYVKELSLRSLNRTIKQFKEEIIRYESRKKTASRAAVTHDV